MSGILDEFRGLRSAYPVRNFDFLKLDFKSQLAQFAGYIFDGSVSLQRAADSRSDVFRQMRDLAISVIVGERCLFDRRQIA